MQRFRSRLLLIGIIALAAFLRFYLLHNIPPGLYPDEAQNGVDALHALDRADFRVFYPANNGREGLFINLQALAIQVFGPSAWTLRAVSAVIGTLTVLFLYFLARELGLLLFSFQKRGGLGERDSGGAAASERNERRAPRNAWDRHWGQLSNGSDGRHCEGRDASNALDGARVEAYALLASFLLAVSFWHINFSRIGFRAIMLPFLSTAAFFFLLRALRMRRITDSIASGFLTALLLYTYIASRVIPVFVAIIAFIDIVASRFSRRAVVAWGLFGIAFLLAIVPLAGYFSAHPEDFIGRAGDVSIFNTDNPVRAAMVSAGQTMLMFNIRGDGNWRHNVAGSPMFDVVTGTFFLIGFVVLFFAMFRRGREGAAFRFSTFFLITWFGLLLIPSIATAEGLPHALRSLGALPPAILLAAWGAMWLWRRGQRTMLLSLRGAAASTCLALILIMNVHHYFFRWAGNENVQGAFRADLTKIAAYLSDRDDALRYVIVNESGTPVDGVPVQSATIRFLTQDDPAIRYLTAERINEITPEFDKTAIVTTVSPSTELDASLRALFPSIERLDENGITVYRL